MLAAIAVIGAAAVALAGLAWLGTFAMANLLDAGAHPSTANQQPLMPAGNDDGAYVSPGTPGDPYSHPDGPLADAGYLEDGDDGMEDVA